MCSLLFNHLQIHNKCIFYEFLNETEKATPNYTVADCRVSNNHFQLMIFCFFLGGGCCSTLCRGLDEATIIIIDSFTHFRVMVKLPRKVLTRH